MFLEPHITCYICPTENCSDWCLHYNESVAKTNPIRRALVTSKSEPPHHRFVVEIKQKPYPVWCLRGTQSDPVQCKHGRMVTGLNSWCTVQLAFG
jgi:hypothetical protein